jgi:RNA polymerase sigma-70 factor (ECF subfamily)
VTEAEQNRIFENWLTRYKGLIFKVVRVYAGTAMDQDDLFQEIAIQVWRSVPAFREESAVTTWIYRISFNVAIKWVRKEKRLQETEGLDRITHTLHENKTHSDERLDWLLEEISKLDEICRSVTLLLLDDFSYKEMASILGISESNIGVKINRIKKHLINKSKKYDHHGI